MSRERDKEERDELAARLRGALSFVNATAHPKIDRVERAILGLAAALERDDLSNPDVSNGLTRLLKYSKTPGPDGHPEILSQTTPREAFEGAVERAQRFLDRQPDTDPEALARALADSVDDALRYIDGSRDFNRKGWIDALKARCRNSATGRMFWSASDVVKDGLLASGVAPAKLEKIFEAQRRRPRDQK